MQTAGKKILEVIKSGSDENIGELLKDFFAPAFTSTPLKESSLEFYGHFVGGFFRAAVSSIVSSGASPALISSIDLIYPYYIHFRNHVKTSDPIFLPKAFHLVLLNITKTVDYISYALKFASYLYEELQLTTSEDNIDVFTNPAILWNFAGKLEKQPNFTDFVLSLRVRHMALKLLALKAKNLPSLVTKLGSTILRFRQQVSTSGSNKSHSANLESAAVWNNIIETVLLVIGKEDKPKELLLNILELHVHHARFISFYHSSHSDSLKNYGNMRSFLDQHIDENDEYTEGVFEICDAILFIGDNSKKSTIKAVASMFGSVKNACIKLASAVNKNTLTFGQVSLICDSCGIFIEGLSQYEPLKEGKLKAGCLKECVTLLEAYIKMLHSYYQLQLKNPAENKDKASRQDVYMCMSYSIFMEILYTLSETDDSNKWLLETSAVAKNYIHDLQSLSETPAKTKDKHMVYIGQWLRKFGRLCYNQGHNEAGIAIYRLLLEQMMSQDLSEDSNEQNYLKTHEYLAECQKRNNDWDGSYKTILSCILIASVSAFSTAVKIWLRLKKEAVKDIPDITNKTFRTLIQDNKSFVGEAEIDVAALLQLEWQSIQTSSNFFRKKHRDYGIALLTDLAELSSDPFVKSRYLYELALILWNVPQPTSKSGKDYLIEAIHLVEPILKSAQPKDKFLLGQAYLLLYTFELEEFNQKFLQREKLLEPNSEKVPEKLKPSTLETELTSIEKLDLSLKLFEEASTIGEEMCNNMMTTEIVALVYSIVFAASIYTASLKPLDAVRALTVAVQVCRSTENTELKLKVVCQICNILSSLGYPALARSLIDVKFDDAPDSTATYSEKMSSLVKTLTEAELFAEQGQFSKALQLTQEVLSNCNLTTSKNKSSCAVLGCAKRLLSKLKLMPQHMVGDAPVDVSNNEGETPLDLAYEAMRMYTAVIHCMVQPDAPASSNSDIASGVSFDFEKYEIVSEVLKSLLHLSQLYCHVGEEREAKCYIKEGLRLAEIFVLPRWSATFYLQLVRINFLSGKSSDIIKAKHEAQLILLLSNNNTKDKKEVPPESPCPEVVEVTVCTPENQMAKSLITNQFKWSAECSDEESTLKADTFADHTPLSKLAVSKLVFSPASGINPPDSPTHSESCLCQKCQDLVCLELQLKCQMISGEYDYAFGQRPFQENLQSDIEAFHRQLSGMIKSNLEHTFLNKVLRPLVKERSSGFRMSSDRSVHLRNCCIDLARTYLIRAQIFEQESKFQIAFNSAKTGLELLCNISGYNNSDVFFIRAGLALSIANTIPCISDCINIKELLEPNLNLDLLSSQLLDMSLNPKTQHSLLHAVDNSGDNIDSCVNKIAALSIEGDTPLKTRGDKTSEPKRKLTGKSKSQNLESVKTNSIQNSILLSPFPKRDPAEERAAMKSPSDVDEILPKEKTVSMDSDCELKTKTKTIRRGSKTGRTCRATNKPKEIRSRADAEIETGRECSLDAGDDCKKGNFDKIIEREIEEEPVKKEENLQTLEKIDTSKDVDPLCKDLVDSLKIEDADLKSASVKAKVSKNVKVTKPRGRRAKVTIANKTPDSKTDENTPPVIDGNELQSPCKKEKTTERKVKKSEGIIKSEIEETLEEKIQTSEVDTIKDSATVCKSPVDSFKFEEVDSTATNVKAQVPKRSKVSRNVKVTKARGRRGNTVVEDTSDPKNDENTSPIPDKTKVQSPCGEEKTNDCKIGNSDKIIEEKPEKRDVLEEKMQTSEKLDIIADLVPVCKSPIDSIKIEDTDSKSTSIEAQVSKRSKVSRNVKETKTRARRGKTVIDDTSDSKNDETPPVVEVEEKIPSPCEKKKSTATKTSRANNRKGTKCAAKMSKSSSLSPLDDKCEKMKSESSIFKSRKVVDSYAFDDDQGEEDNIYAFDEIDKDVTVTKKVAKTKRQPTAKTKSTGWQKRLAEASNRIGREVKRGEVESPSEKRFSLSPVSLTPAMRQNESLDSISSPDDDSSVLSTNNFGCFSFEDIKTDMRDWESFSEDLLNVSSPELLRAAKDDDGSDDCNSTYRERRPARRAPARTLVSTIYKKGSEQEDTLKDCQDENLDLSQNDMRLRSLESAFEQMRFFPPCSLYNFTCKALAMNYLVDDPDKAAFYLAEAQAVTLRHSLITQLSRKIRKIIKDQNSSEGLKKSHLSVQNAPALEILTQAKKALSFGQKTSNIHSLIEAIDPAWTVCHVSVVASPNFSSPPILIVTQYRHNTSPTIVSLPGYSQSEGSGILKLYESIQIANRKSLSLLNKNEWWNARHNLDNKMQTVLNQIEQHWLGCWKGILLGHLTNEDDRKKLKTSAEKLNEIIKEKCSKAANQGLLQILIDSCDYLSVEELDAAIGQVTGLDDVHGTEFTSIKSQIQQLNKSLNSSISDRHPLILILDKVVQHLPWENMPILRNRRVSRIPSLYYLKVQMSYLHHKNSVITDGFDPKNTFYVLNPDDNLPCTQEIFQKSFESTEGWEGVVSKPPTADQFISALTQKDTMIYCGHGNGNKYLHGDYLQQLNCRAAALLMGCSSGHMEARGILDETGMINNYYLAFCPVIVANLWDVTDRDIDRFLQTLLNNWILSKDETKMSLSEAVVKARTACKLSYLIGCAPVVYGIPL